MQAPAVKAAERTEGLWRQLGFGQHSTRAAMRELSRAAWSEAPLLLVLTLVLTVMLGVAGALRFVALGIMVAALSEAPSRLPLALGLVVAVSFVCGAVPSVTGTLTNELNRRVDLHFNRRMMACTGMPYGIAHLENPQHRDLLSMARGIADQGGGPGGSIAGYLSLLALKISGLISVLLLAGYWWWLGVCVAVGALLIRRRMLTIWFQTAEALMGDVAGLRRSEYLRDLVLCPAAAKEYRLFGLGAWLVHRHDLAWSAAMRPVWRRRRQVGRSMLVVDAAVLMLAGAAAVPIVLGLMSGELNAADAVILGGALSAIVALGGFLPDADFPIRYGCLALPPLLELEQRVSTGAAASGAAGLAPPDGPHHHVRFAGVQFRYPGTERHVLDDLNLTIGVGTSVAIVGANGAGKTTLIKLLARLYEPTAGAVLVDGVDLRTFDPDSWRRKVGVIFQDFARYELPARDNVGFGALHLAGDKDALCEVADRADVLSLVRGLPRGWDSPLSRSYSGGAEISGGEWQRIALARTLLAVRGGARLLILDEPTASLDVRAESEFYDRFLDLTAGITTILISHRFSTVRRAERICVLHEGRILEDASHDELVASGGTYARMFQLQAMRFSDG